MSLNTEEKGISCEIAICDYFGIDVDDNYRSRADETLVANLIPLVEKTWEKYSIPAVTAITAYNQNSVDFALDCYDEDGDQGTLSVKSNFYGLGKICPQKYGQPTRNTWYTKYFKDVVDQYYDSYPDNFEDQCEVFKNIVYYHTDEIINLYWRSTFSCSYLVVFYDLEIDDGVSGDAVCLSGQNPPDWNFDLFTFNIDFDDLQYSWHLYYDGWDIGEFQIHKSSRKVFKFRWIMPSVLAMLDDGDSIIFE